jgi:hypothetical protein
MQGQCVRRVPNLFLSQIIFTLALRRDESCRRALSLLYVFPQRWRNVAVYLYSIRAAVCMVCLMQRDQFSAPGKFRAGNLAYANRTQSPGMECLLFPSHAEQCACWVNLRSDAPFLLSYMVLKRRQDENLCWSIIFSSVI